MCVSVYISPTCKYLAVMDCLFSLHSPKLLKRDRQLEVKKYLFIDDLKSLDMLKRWALLSYLFTKEL